MTTAEIIEQLQTNLPTAAGVVLLLSVIAFILFRYGIARLFMSLAARSSSKYDDILVRHLKPFRMAWLAPLVVVYIMAFLFPSAQEMISKIALFLILWVSMLTIAALLTAINQIYESRPNYNGVSIQGYLDIAKLLFLLVGIILSITLITGQSPVVLLTGLGAIAAVLLLIFQTTILSLVASVQIAANDLLKEGDWVEVPSYDADGDVVNINLHTIKIRNFDMTYSVIPTYKMIDVPYRNWRGMIESGGRRIQRALSVDMVSIKFCDSQMLDRLRKIDLLTEFMEETIRKLETYQDEHRDHYDSPLDGPQITNIEVFRAYINVYLKHRPDIYITERPFLVRVLAPTPNGLPVELYIFAKTTDWVAYEMIQAEIFDHLLAAAQNFDLRVFQQPTGLDFSAMVKGTPA
ncbi:MAG: mechanosensitive ion channel family protein [Bellilinea sp.]